jgi:hypothetical protein
VPARRSSRFSHSSESTPGARSSRGTCRRPTARRPAPRGSSSGGTSCRSMPKTALHSSAARRLVNDMPCGLSTSRWTD